MTLGKLISKPDLAFSGSMAVFGVGGTGLSPPAFSCGRNVKGTPKMFTYSGS